MLISPQEWLEILNFQGGEMYPDIGYRGTISGVIADLNSDYQVDLSSTSNIDRVKEVYLEDSDGDKFPYDNWIYNKEIQILELDPETSKSATRDLPDYVNYVIVWVGFLPEFTKTSEVLVLDPPKLVLFQKICIKEALFRILNDHSKLDRYRTLVGRTNEYALMAQIRDLTNEIEIKKRTLTDTKPIRTF
jgi:hypothetical protein